MQVSSVLVVQKILREKKTLKILEQSEMKFEIGGSSKYKLFGGQGRQNFRDCAGFVQEALCPFFHVMKCIYRVNPTLIIPRYVCLGVTLCNPAVYQDWETRML